MSASAQKIPYVVRLKTVAALHLERSYRIMLKEAQVLFEDDSRLNEHGVKVHYGLSITVFLSSDSSDTALLEASALAETMLSLASFSVSTIAKRCAPFQVIDVNPANQDRDIVQFQNLAGGVPLARRFREPEMQVLLDRLGAVADEKRERLLRAITWYRKSLEELDTLDCFVNVWAGLEAINEPIKEKFALPLDHPVRSCPKCGEVVVTVPTQVGIAHILTKLLGEPEEVWKEARNTRKELVHGFGSLQHASTSAARLLPILRKALMRGVLELIGMPETEQRRFMREPLTAIDERPAKLTGTIHDLPSEDIVSGASVPSIEIVKSDAQLRKTEDGKILESSRIDIRLVGFEGRWTPRHIWAPIAHDPEDTAAEMKLTQP